MENFNKSEFRLLARKGNDGGEDRVWFSSGGESKLGEWTRAVVEIHTEDENCFQVHAVYPRLSIPRLSGLFV